MAGPTAGVASERRPHFGADRGLALIRLLTLPVAVLGERLLRFPGEANGAFPYVVLVATIYAVGVLALTYSPYRYTVPPVIYVGVGLLLICALALSSGGETSEVRRAFFLPPSSRLSSCAPGRP